MSAFGLIYGTTIADTTSEYTVTTTTKTFTELFVGFSDKYKNYAAASALFYWDNGSTHGVRVEAPSILKEFVDNVAWGSGKLAQSR